MRQTIIILLTSILSFSCTYENEENLYKQQTDTEYNYEEHIKPYIESNCLRCHTASNPEGNIVYDTYNQVLIGVKDGTFLGSIKYEHGISIMPPAPSPKTDNITIEIIEKWIEQGAKEKK